MLTIASTTHATRAGRLPPTASRRRSSEPASAAAAGRGARVLSAKAFVSMPVPAGRRRLSPSPRRRRLPPIGPALMLCQGLRARASTPTSLPVRTKGSSPRGGLPRPARDGSFSSHREETRMHGRAPASSMRATAPDRLLTSEPDDGQAPHGRTVGARVLPALMLGQSATRLIGIRG